MAIPDYQSIMLPLLRFAADQQEYSLRETIDILGDKFGLKPEERKELLPSGRQATFDNRVGWARTYLKKAGLLTSTRRGYYQITSRGLNVLAEKPDELSAKFLTRFEEFQDFRDDSKRKARHTSEIEVKNTNQTPEEIVEQAIQELNDNLADELIQTIKECSPAFFERLVVDLLVKMGYGGTRKDAGQTLGCSGDGGIDGIIKEDRLGLDVIYIQAKRWENPVGRPEIQKFAGALQGMRAKKGVFITTSCFTTEAKKYVSHIDSKIILIDNHELAKFMIEHDVGVSSTAAYVVKRLDTDYFSEE
ncbi:MAG: restriction endonuclease [Cyanobacteria bacterium P01_E01_bin.6]